MNTPPSPGPQVAAPDASPPSVDDLTPDELRAELHQLHIRQLELERQNDHLRRAQAERETTRAHYFDFYHHAPVGYVTINEAGLIVEANQTAAALLGLVSEALVGQPMSSFIPAEHHQTYELFLKRLMEVGEPQSSDLPMIKVDGTAFRAHLTLIAAHDPAGQPVCHVVLTDMTGRLLAEEALQTSQQELNRQNGLFVSLLKNLPVGVFMVEAPSGRPLIANDAALHLLGRGILPDASRDNLSKVYNAYQVGGDQPYPPEKMPIVRGMNGEKSQVDDMMVVRPDGTRTYLEIFGSPVTDDQGRIWASLVSFVDITARKQNEVLMQASLREKDSLLKEIHHRVKNNLQIISSLLRLQAYRIDNPIAKASLDDMQARIRSMALIHEHLHRSDNLAAVDLSTYLQSLCHQLLRSLVATPGLIELRMDIAPVSLDIDQAVPCGLLVNELVSNALKHAFPDGRRGEIQVTLQALDHDRGFRLRVADNGVGLPPDFDQQLLTSLGLNLISNLAKQLGGQLEIENGPGTVFAVEFNPGTR